MKDMGFLILFLIFLYVLNCFTNRKKKKLYNRKQEYLDKKGIEGENNIYNILDRYKYEGHLYRNVFIPLNYNKYTEIDILLVNSYGIFVVESKNWNGTIYGERNSEKWTVYSRNSEQLTDNPCFQKEYHVKRLKEYLRLKNNPYYSIVVFGYKTRLNLDGDEFFTSIVGIKDLDCYMKKIIKGEKILSNSDINRINEKISSCICKDSNFKEKHIERVKNIKRRTV